MLTLSASGCTTKRRAPSGLTAIDVEWVWGLGGGDDDDELLPQERQATAKRTKGLRAIMAG
jgi:hypothetical protein